MRAPLVLPAVTLLIACASVPSRDAEIASQQAMQAAFTRAPDPEPIAIPSPPPARTQREIEGLATQALARWMLPGEAGAVAHAGLWPARFGRLAGGSLFAGPRASGLAGLCDVRGWDVWLRVVNEARLTPQQALDPPLQPQSYRPVTRYKVLGSTLAGTAGGPDCARAVPSVEWIEAPSAAALHRAASAVERAQRSPASARIACTQWRYDEARGETVYPPCADARALLRRLTPDLIKRVRPTACDTDVPGPAPCIALEYQDPAAPGTYSFYEVRIGGTDRAPVLRIVQGMLPPH